MNLNIPPEKRLYGLIAVLVVIIGCVAGALIGNGQDKKLATFSAPLLEHAVPESSRLADSLTGTNKGDNGTDSYACLILQSELSQEELEAFYQDTELIPAREGDTVTLKVYPIQDDSLETLKETSQYQEEGGDYWYIYLYSARPSASD